MCPAVTTHDLQLELEAIVGALEHGTWRTVLYGRRAHDLARDCAGLTNAAHVVVLTRQLAMSMEAQAVGRPDASWRLLQDAARLLPPRVVNVDPRTGERRARRIRTPGCPGVPGLTARVATVAWREQTELGELRDRFAPNRSRARAVLIEAAVQFLIWVEFDHAAFYRLDADPDLVRNDPTNVDRDRRSLLRRATLLRQFADPYAGDIAPPVWHDIGRWRGLRAAANDSLGRRRHPYCGADPAVPVRQAHLEAWQAARKWLDGRG